MNRHRHAIFTVCALSWALAAATAHGADALIASPDSRTTLRIAEDGTTFTVMRKGETVIAASPLGLELDGAPAFGALALESRENTAVDRTITLVATKAASAREHYRGATLAFREAGGGRRLFIDVRAYDDGVAFRYRMEDAAPVRLRGERTAFVPAGDPACLVTPYHGAHELQFERLRVSQLKEGVAYDAPVVCATSSGRTHYAITQAHLHGYAGASLWREGAALRLRLSAVPGRPGPAYTSPAGLTTAWRAIMMADRAGELIESHLVGNLNPPPEGDFSWVKPGKAAWDWWSGPLVGMKADMAAYKRFIDFAAESGFPYYLIDVNWAWGPSGCCDANPETDISRPAQGIAMPELVRYAEAKGVGLLLWAHWKHVDARIDEVLDTYARWGIKGVKVDFMERDDQDMVAFYQRVAQATAKRKMLLNMHGAWFAQLAEWGVDFVKVDDIAAPAHHAGEVALIRRAIDVCGRPMVLSLSPGPSLLEQAAHLQAHANQWRVCNDFWDTWPQLRDNLVNLVKWAPHARPGAWPDADMLPVGKIGLRNYDGEPATRGERDTRFTRDEQLLMLTAWTCARSPLILGNDLRRLDDWTFRLVTNPEVLALLRVPGSREWHSTAQGHRFVCHGPQGTWAAWLNTGEAAWQATLPAWLPEARRDCWARADLSAGTRTLTIPPHDARLVRCA